MIMAIAQNNRINIFLISVAAYIERMDLEREKEESKKKNVKTLNNC